MEKGHAESTKFPEAFCKSKKAQIISYDIFFAVTLFLFSFLLVNVAWNFNLRSFNEEIDVLEAEEVANLLADKLVSTAGVPSNWEYLTDVNSYGLANQPRELSLTKVLKLENENYSTFKGRMNLEMYEVYMEIVSSDGNVYWGYGLPVADSNIAIGQSRVVDFNGSIRRFDLRLYR